MLARLYLHLTYVLRRLIIYFLSFLFSFFNFLTILLLFSFSLLLFELSAFALMNVGFYLITHLRELILPKLNQVFKAIVNLGKDFFFVFPESFLICASNHHVQLHRTLGFILFCETEHFGPSLNSLQRLAKTR